MTPNPVLTPKQKLLAHVLKMHEDQANRTLKTRFTFDQLAEWHAAAHKHHLTHKHGIYEGRDTRVLGVRTGGEIEVVHIFLAPPKNPLATRNGDRNWSLNVTNKTGGWRRELPGTRADDVDGAIATATRILGYVADWEAVGWGWKVKDG